MSTTEGRRRVAIEGVKPEIDDGRFPIKRTVGETVEVEADIFADGHDELTAVLLSRREGDPAWNEVPMEHLGNDRWRGEFTVRQTGRCLYTMRAWVDRFGTWRKDLAKKIEAGQDVSQDMLVGAALVERTARRASGASASSLRAWARRLRAASRASAHPVPDSLAAEEPADQVDALAPELAELVRAWPDRRQAAGYGRELSVVVDRERARFGAWYEMFPRSASPEPGTHGTFKDVEARLPYVAEMGFDVLYLPPVHPIGRSFRKGKNNSVVAGPDDPGSPWAIGGEEGGHTSIHPHLGTIEDFDRLVSRAGDYGIEVAMDLAYQCSANHPYLREHPEWFRRRPDGTIQYAENPPKKYQDIYPLDFETAAWRELWEELKRVVEFWIGHGVRIFRVDNPHTKPFAFWEWLIGGVKARHPDVLFLSEAFTRPMVMYRLAKVGFTQSYTYFAWRNTKQELTDYFLELTRSEAREYFRPNLWPNTPDILTETLQNGGRPAFVVRFVLAATLGASYGIYGPAFELCENRPLEEGREEYLDSEKYEVRHWDIDRKDSLSGLIGQVNRIRRDNPALQWDRSLQFHPTDNDQLLCYSKRSPDGGNVILVVVNLDPLQEQSGWVHLWLHDLGLEMGAAFVVRDLLNGGRFAWGGSANFVNLDPAASPVHIFRVEPPGRADRSVRSRRSLSGGKKPGSSERT
jgi:starch synthase (maltosyl-transferring)